MEEIESEAPTRQLHSAIKNDSLPDFLNNIKKDGNVSNSSVIKDYLRSSLVFDIAKMSAVKILEYILGKGFSVNQVKKSGETPLHYACEHASLETVKMIFQTSRQTNSVTANGVSPLHKALLNQNVGVVEYLLHQKQVEVNKQDSNGLTPLMHAVLLGNFPAFRMLVKKNDVDFEASDLQGMNVFHYAAQTAEACYLHELLTNRPESKSAHAIDKNGKQPFQISVSHNLKEHVELFLKFILLSQDVLASALQSSFENGHFDQFALIQTTLKDSAVYQSYLSTTSSSTHASQKNEDRCINSDSLSTSMTSNAESHHLFSSIIDSIGRPDYEIPMSDITRGKKVAEGASSTVYEGTYYGQKVALKVSKPMYEKLFGEEIKLLAHAKHPAILQFFGYSVDDENMAIILVTEFEENGSLANAIYSQKREKCLESLPKKIDFLLDIASACSYLHAKGIVHRDLNPSNILISGSMRGKVSDFGVSRMYSSELENVTSVTVATVEYMAPESIMKGLYSVKSDVYSFGMIIWEVLSEKRPFENDDPLSVAFKIVQSNTRPSIGADFPPKLAHLVSKCWHKDPAQRPTFLQIRESLSAFLKSVSKK